MNARDNKPQGNVEVYNPEHAGRFTVGDLLLPDEKSGAQEISERGSKRAAQKSQVFPNDDPTDEYPALRN